jgi:uncharacterized protein
MAVASEQVQKVFGAQATMRCPACGNSLQSVAVGDVTVDVCKRGCGGIWFDNHELKKFDEPHEADGQALLEIERNPRISVDYNKRRNCPICDNIVMMRHFFSVQRQVEIDECPNCGGVWLDCGELARIRALFPSEDERKKAAQAYFDEVLGPAPAGAKVPGRPESAGRIAAIFRFLSPPDIFQNPRRG